MSKIAGIDTLEILDSRGNPTLEVMMRLEIEHELGSAAAYEGRSANSRWKTAT